MILAVKVMRLPVAVLLQAAMQFDSDIGQALVPGPCCANANLFPCYQHPLPRSCHGAGSTLFVAGSGWRMPLL